VLSAGQARPLLALDSSREQIRVAELVVRDGLSARQIEARVGAKQKPRRRRRTRQDPHAEAAAEKLTRAFQTKVEIRRRGRRGTVLFHFHSEEELMHLYDQLLQTGGVD
jgi:ParB family chromosome partitioning protein